MPELSGMAEPEVASKLAPIKAIAATVSFFITISFSPPLLCVGNVWLFGPVPRKTAFRIATNVGPGGNLRLTTELDLS